MSDCVRVSELLPFLLNDSLGVDEKEEVRSHLLDCEDCRRELGGTARVWELFSLHPEPEALTARAYGIATEDEDTAAIEAHLEVCASCREELELARASREAIDSTEESPPATPERPDAGAWRAWAAAAMILAAAGVAALTWSELVSGRDRWEDERARLERQIEELEERAESLAVVGNGNVEAERAARLEAERAARETAEAAAAAGERIARLEGRIADLTRPQVNVPTYEIFPADAVVRSAPTDPAPVIAGNDDAALHLILATEDRSEYPDYRISVYAESGDLLWESSGLDRQRAGDFSIHLPAGTLPSGRVSLRVYGLDGGEWKPIGNYEIRVGS